MLQLQQQRGKKSYHQPEEQIVEADQSPLFCLFDEMSEQEFERIPKEIYVKKQPKALEVLDVPTAPRKLDF